MGASIGSILDSKGYQMSADAQAVARGFTHKTVVTVRTGKRFAGYGGSAQEARQNAETVAYCAIGNFNLPACTYETHRI
jgi:hypothetical protein